MGNKEFIYVFLFIVYLSISRANAEQHDIEFYQSENFALGVGVAIVKFDTTLKSTDKSSSRRTFYSPEGNLGLPDISRVTAFYGVYKINPVHGIGFSYFKVNRESKVFNFDKTFEDVRVIGDATISDTSSFFQLDYRYNLFIDYRSKINFHAGIYALDLKYVFKADGELIVGGVTETGELVDEANTFAPLPMIGVDLLYGFTPEWSVATKVAFVAGTFNDVSAFASHTSINAQYKFNRYVGVAFGLVYFDTNVTIDDELDETEIRYSYDGAFFGLHFII